MLDAGEETRLNMKTKQRINNEANMCFVVVFAWGCHLATLQIYLLFFLFWFKRNILTIAYCAPNPGKGTTKYFRKDALAPAVLHGTGDYVV